VIARLEQVLPPPKDRDAEACLPEELSRTTMQFSFFVLLTAILLLRARRPIRPSVPEGVNRRGSQLVKGFFHWYARKRSTEPVWGKAASESDIPALDAVGRPRNAKFKRSHYQRYVVSDC